MQIGKLYASHTDECIDRNCLQNLKTEESIVFEQV